MARNLTPEEIDQLTKAYKQGGAGRWRTVVGGEGGDTSNYLENDYNVGGVNYRPIDGSKAVGGDSGYEESTGLQNYLSDAGNGMMNVYSPSGQYMGQVPKQKDSFLDKLVAASPYIGGALITGGGLGVGPLAGMGASGASAASGAGLLGAGGSDLATSAAWGSGAGLGGDTLAAIGTGGIEAASGAASAAPAVFNPAVDSQIANVAGGLPAYSGAVPGAVDLGSAGGVMATGATNGLLSSAPAATKAVSTAAKTAGLLGSGLEGTDLGKIAGIAAGAAIGSKPTTITNTSQSKTDPRIDPYIYGDDGILAQAKRWQQANKTGLNSQMLEGLNMQYNVNANPENMGAYQQMQRLGSSLMSAPIAGNPFTNGGVRNLGFSNQNAGMATPNANPYKQPTYMK